MNGHKFDHFAKTLACLTSRRGVLRALLVAIGLGALARPEAIQAQESPPVEPVNLENDPAATPRPSLREYCWNTSGDVHGPAQAPTPFLYQPFAWAPVPRSTDERDTFGWVWSSQMDHTRPNYHIDNGFVPDGRIATLGEHLSHVTGGTRLPDPDNSIYDASIPPENLGTIVAYESPSLETFLFYDGHDGHDFAVAGKALAAAPGTVVFAGIHQSTLGRMVEIIHPEGYLTRYAHLATIDIAVGNAIEAPGTPIGTIGGSGWENGAVREDRWGIHLHFSVFRWSVERGAWQITDPFGWDPWQSPSGQADDPLVACNGEISYNLWSGWWPQPYGTDAPAADRATTMPVHGRYLGGSLAEDADAFSLTSLPDAYLGTWSGQGTQTNPPLTWLITIELVGGNTGEVVGTVDYPADPCRGELTLVAVGSATNFTVSEAITDGPCFDGGTFDLTLRDASTVHFRWTHPEIVTVAEGTLTPAVDIPTPAPAPAPATATDVAMFRGNAARTGEMPGPGPDWSNGVTTIWSFATGDAVTSSPAVVDGVVYIGSGDAHIYALDGATGTERWRFPTGSQVFSTPAVVADTVYVGSTDSNIYAIDAATGSERWRFQAGGTVSNDPAVIDGAVYIGSGDGNLYALDAASGAERWRLATGGSITCSPAVADGAVYVGSMDSYVYALDATNGAERWRFQTGQWSASTPAVAGGVVYIGSLDTNVYAIDTATGAERWRFAVGSNVPSSPAVADGVVYIGTYDFNLYALDAETGSEVWRFQTGDVVLSSPAVVDGTIYVGGWDTNVYAIDAASGNERWRVATGDHVDSSPAVIDGVVYIGSRDGSVYAIGGAQPAPVAQATPPPATAATERGNPARTGVMPGPGPAGPPGILWEFQADHDFDAQPVVADGVVYAGNRDAYVYALDAGTGGLRWRFLTEGWASSPTVSAGSVYVGGGFSLYALDAAAGTQRWTYSTGFGGWVQASPAVVDDVVYGTDHNGYVFALDTASGAEIWRFQESGVPLPEGPGDRYMGAPAVADGAVFVSVRDDYGNPGYLYALDAATGAERWRHTLDTWAASPAVANGSVYISDHFGDQLLALDLATGAIRWNAGTGSSPHSPAVVDGQVVVGTAGGDLYAFDASSGAMRWQFAAGDQLHTPVVANGVIYIPSWDGHLYAIDATTSAETWRFELSALYAPAAVVDGVVYLGTRAETLYAIGDAAEQAPPASTSLAGLSYVLPDGLWLIDDSGRASQIVEGMISNPAWSADGSRVAYVRTLGSVDPDAIDIEGFQIEIANADGTGQVIAVPNRNNPYSESLGQEGYWSLGPVKWTPDGGALIYFRGFGLRGGKLLTRVDLATGAETEIVLPELLPGPFDIGPDGTLAILASPFSAAAWIYHLYLRDASGQTTLITELPENVVLHTPSLSPDGAEIAMGWLDNSLVAIDRANGDPRWLVTGNPDTPLGSPAWSPDGDTIAYVVTDPAADWLEPGTIWTVPASGDGSPSAQFSGSHPAWRPIPAAP